MFITANLIPSGVSPFASARAAVRAARVMLDLMKDSARKGNSFVFELTRLDTARLACILYV